MNLYVLSLNDFPIGVYSSRDRAELAGEEHKVKNPPGNMRAFYHVRGFELDQSARL